MGKPRTHGFDIKESRSKESRGIDSKGIPITKGPSGAPGAPNVGTPGYIRQAVAGAEAHVKNISGMNRSEHRISNDWKSGTSSAIRGGETRTEKIKGGQAG